MKKKIVVVIDSERNLGQCVKGLKLLGEAAADATNGVSVTGVYIRNAWCCSKFLWLLASLNEADVDTVIVGASQVAHLPCCADAYLRNHLRNDQIQVIGVAFEGETKKDSLAAQLAITQYPETQVRFAGLGKKGFTKACQLALNGSLPPLTLPNRAPEPDFTLATAIDKARIAATAG